ncbi:hypothetical protein F3Y22_tig00110678pilonHSYRG00264 [Hibiscus syriacus]|uniref:Uncharacterized protein n=1 Tax=Hibiscus syriacus TaxID=106335 RepID=A0A6A2ZVF7_HIBSY|nr:hypothetical protein F3Y22_tig00110678pilonHSYRG00264 [Hibiscus syriacus]
MQTEDNQVPLLSDQDSNEDVAQGSGEKSTSLESMNRMMKVHWVPSHLFLGKSSGFSPAPVFLMSIAFLDPGNSERDLQAGAITTLIGADIHEVIGSAIAIKILSNDALPLWAGVFITPCVCSKSIKQAVGVVGRIIMPHNVFLHSALMQSREIDRNKKARVQEALRQYLEEKYGGGLIPILYIWVIGLLATRQSSTITGIYAGQFITRVALIFDTSERTLDVLNKWLNALQSIQILFALIPLLFLVSKEQIMGACKIGNVLKILSDQEFASFMFLSFADSCKARNRAVDSDQRVSFTRFLLLRSQWPSVHKHSVCIYRGSIYRAVSQTTLL